MSEILLNVRNIARRVKVPRRGWGHSQTIDILKGVSLQIVSGEIVALVGESGSGKTTLAQCITELQGCDEGDIFFAGTLGIDMQIVFQDPYGSLNPRMRVKDILSEPLYIHRKSNWDQDYIDQRLNEVMTDVGLLPSDLEKFPHQFSGGQRQRISLARALVLKPKLLIADEAVSALDVSIQAQILNLLKKLQKRYDLSILFISHDLSVVRYLADWVLVMYRGHIVERIPAQHLMRSKHPYTQALLGAMEISAEGFEIDGTRPKENYVLWRQAEDSPNEICPFFKECKYSDTLCATEFPPEREMKLSNCNERLKVRCHHAK